MNTKVCGKCGEEKPVSEFAKNKAKPDGLQYQCRDCQREYGRRHYEENKQKYIDGAANRIQQLRDKIWEYKNNHACVDCGESDPIVLEFDHLRDKEFNIGNATTLGYGWEKVEKEIEKCDVVCANDHIRRTHKRGGWVRNIEIKVPPMAP